MVSDTLWNNIEKLSNNIEVLSEKDKSIVIRFRKDIEKIRNVPADFVERMAKITTIAYPAWQEAREKANFSIFSPHLEKIVELEKEYCGYINLPGPKYNCLLDDYEEGMTIDKLRKEFEYLKPELIGILEKIKTSVIYSKQHDLDLKLSVEKQKELCKIVINKMQLPNEKTRLDVSTHPFTTSMGYDDVRITTSYERSNPLFSFFSTVHEAGHALYELEMPKDEFKDNDHWPHQIYVRESKRMIGDFVTTELHLRRIKPTPKPIGMGSYNMDSHNVQRYVDRNGHARNEGDIQINPGGPYPISYGAIVPKTSECTNLLVPVCVSSSHIAYGSIRMEPVFMILGQSAATAAAFAIDDNINLQNVSYPKLKSRLLADGQVLILFIGLGFFLNGLRQAHLL